MGGRNVLLRRVTLPIQQIQLGPGGYFSGWAQGLTPYEIWDELGQAFVNPCCLNSKDRSPPIHQPWVASQNALSAARVAANPGQAACKPEAVL
jgi:hypothetical protein